MKCLLLLILSVLASAAPAFSQSDANTLEAWANKVRADAVPLYESSSPKGESTEQWFAAPEHGFFGVRNVTLPTVTPFLPDKSKASGAAVLVIPGGAFLFLDISNEGVPVAQWLANHGIAAFLVRRETPRLCRGGSRSLTFPGVCFTPVAVTCHEPCGLRILVFDFAVAIRPL